MPKMKNIRLVSILLLLVMLSCNLPLNRSTNPSEGQMTPTPESLNTPTLSPPTPTPTPLPSVRLNQGDTALLLGDTQRARQEYQSAALATSDPEIQAAALVGIARSYFEERNYQQTADTLLALINEHPANQSLANGYYFLAETYLNTGEYQKAAEAYEMYLQLKPGILDDLIAEKAGEAWMAAGQYEQAIQSFQKAIQASDTQDTARLKIRIGQAYQQMNDLESAIRQYLDAYQSTSNEYYKAQANFLAGQAYLILGFPEQAYARFQDSVNNFPRYYDTYSGLIELVNAGQPVNQLNRGLVNYFAGQYALAAEVLLGYINNNPDHDGIPHHYRALALRQINNIEGALEEWQTLIRDHPGDSFYSTAWQEIAYTQWAFLENFEAAASTLLDFVSQNPSASEAPNALFSAARILERSNRLTRAAETWERLLQEYPAASISPRAQFLAGITYYRIGADERALNAFQRQVVLSTSPNDQAAALLWIGKIQQRAGNLDDARASWQQAASLDPTGYYSERADELLNNQPPLHPPAVYDLGVDWASERQRAEDWIRDTFSLPPETDLEGLGDLAQNPRFIRGMALWELGLYQTARGEFESLREEISSNPTALYRFLNIMLEIGAYRPAIFASRQILNLAGMDNLQTLTAPRFFNLVRFGAYYKDVVMQEANETGLHPLLLFSIIRQESFFETFVISSAGARGLMQIMPATGQELAERYGYPDFQVEDLHNPLINIRLGAKYLANQRDYFGGDLYLALAAYNGGPGNAYAWSQLSGGDPDLFVEVIRFEETQRYIRSIAEIMNIYRLIYERK
ncbi:transglycosylase SLT domain-containing protein [Bellilinea sp.]|uniref:lytic transglycosylase domain-containing protein n=1 Tax=Bellilinea sp. TaxID=2838785 RepID=UPI002ADD6E40|nr:transglycosylase SLT domain-containing protein [Bellilinea sp.]